MKVIFYREKLTYGNSRHLREQTLILPSNPKWFLKLQKRFSKSWHEKFKNVRGDIPRQPLVLHRRGQHNRPLDTLAVRKLYLIAVEKAAGVKVPFNVLRRAGADHYIKQNGSGVLHKMGWCKASTFNFTWLPREFFRSKKET